MGAERRNKQIVNSKIRNKKDETVIKGRPFSKEESNQLKGQTYKKNEGKEDKTKGNEEGSRYGEMVYIGEREEVEEREE